MDRDIADLLAALGTAAEVSGAYLFAAWREEDRLPYATSGHEWTA